MVNESMLNYPGRSFVAIFSAFGAMVMQLPLHGITSRMGTNLFTTACYHSFDSDTNYALHMYKFVIDIVKCKHFMTVSAITVINFIPPR